MSRQFWVGAIFKVDPNSEKSKSLVDSFVAIANSTTEIFIAPPLMHIAPLRGRIKPPKGSVVTVGAQHCSGHLIGEVSPWQLSEAGIKTVILGHSDRRVIFKDDHFLIAATTSTAIDLGLNVILCISEIAQLHHISPHIAWVQIVIVYQPQGDYTPTEIQNEHKKIRTFISNHVSPDVAKTIRIVFGGNVETVGDFGKIANNNNPDVDGFLIANVVMPELVTNLSTVSSNAATR